MSILIKGMEMPRENELIIISSNGDVEKVKCDGTSWLCDSEAIEIPPHGRLIDADALIRQMEQMVKETNNVRYAWIDELGISLAPTIIEAEGE